MLSTTVDNFYVQVNLIRISFKNTVKQLDLGNLSLNSSYLERF